MCLQEVFERCRERSNNLYSPPYTDHRTTNMDRSRITLMEDLCRILCETGGAQRTLERIVQHVAQKMDAVVCSVYALNKEKEFLTLQATFGLNKKECVGRIGMRGHEGLTVDIETAQKEKSLPVWPSFMSSTLITFVHRFSHVNLRGWDVTDIM